MIQRILFWLRARTRHGTHSPFIYSFLDRALYTQPGTDGPELRLLRAAVTHFCPERVGADPAASDASARIQKEFPGLRRGVPPYDLYLFEKPGSELLEWLSDPGNFHNETVVFTAGLDTPAGRAAWHQAVALPQVRVSLETWRAGLLFFRREQAPEHFKIRI